MTEYKSLFSSTKLNKNLENISDQPNENPKNTLTKLVRKWQLAKLKSLHKWHSNMAFKLFIELIIIEFIIEMYYDSQMLLIYCVCRYFNCFLSVLFCACYCILLIYKALCTIYFEYFVWTINCFVLEFFVFFDHHVYFDLQLCFILLLVLLIFDISNACTMFALLNLFFYCYLSFAECHSNSIIYVVFYVCTHKFVLFICFPFQMECMKTRKRVARRRLE